MITKESDHCGDFLRPETSSDVLWRDEYRLLER